MQSIHSPETIQRILSNTYINDVSEYKNEYSEERLKDLELWYSRAESITDAYAEHLQHLRKEWVKELQTIGNPYVLYMINRRINALRTLLKRRGA